MYLALQMEKIDIGNGRIILIPFEIIEGKYDKESDIFIGNDNIKYESMEECFNLNLYYFGNPILKKHLLNRYGNVENEELYKRYFNDNSDLGYLALYDYDSMQTKVMELNFKKVETMLFTQNIQPTTESLFNEVEKDTYTFNIKKLKELKKCQNVEEVKKYIDNLILAGNYISQFNLSESTDNFQLDWSTPYSELGLTEKIYTKKQLLLAVKNSINNLDRNSLSKEEFTEKTDNILDAYNELVKKR